MHTYVLRTRTQYKTGLMRVCGRVYYRPVWANMAILGAIAERGYCYSRDTRMGKQSHVANTRYC
jgi:hypothetical protein